MRRKTGALLALLMLSQPFTAIPLSAQTAANAQTTVETTQSYYTEKAVEQWFAAPDTASLQVALSDVSIAGEPVAAWPLTVEKNVEMTFSVTPPETGEYILVPEYRPSGEVLASDALFDVSLDGGDSVVTQLPILWADAERGAVDRSGNEILADQEAVDAYVSSPFTAYTNVDKDAKTWSLTAGETATFTVTPTVQAIEIQSLRLYRAEETAAYEAGAAQADDVPTITIEAEDYALKSDSYVRAASVRNAALSPYDTYAKMMNVVDGSTWDTAGQKILWEFEAEQSGYYRLGFRCQQNGSGNKTVFRRIEIDGAAPFAEWEAAAFAYTGSSGYRNYTLQVNGEDALVYLEKGAHTIAMTASAGAYEPVYEEVQALMSDVNTLGLALLKLTAGSVDTNRTWDMAAYMPDATEKLAEYADRADAIYEELAAIDGDEPVYAMDLLTVSEKLRKMIETPETIPNKTEEISRGDDSAAKYLGNVLSALVGQGISIDRIYFYGQEKLPRAQVSFLTGIAEGTKRFFWSFLPEAASGSGTSASEDKEELDVWVGQSTVVTGVLQQLLDETYNEENGVNIRLSVMPSEQKLVLANAAGANPDVVLAVSSGTPFTFASRGALKNLLDYDDFLEFYNSEYQLASLVSTSYADGVYGAVDSRNFNLLFYRKDILSSLNLQVPDTWDDVRQMMPTLLRNQMNFYLPISVSTTLKSLGSTSPFIFQEGGDLYAEDGASTAIDSEASTDAITDMTEFYRIYGMQQTVASFYNSFRYGEVPIGIGDFSMYLQLTMAAPELAGLWGVALSPGTAQDDGSVLRYQPANSTASMIFKNTDQPEEAWQLLRWWLDSDTQLEFSMRMRIGYGAEYQWNTANVKAFSQLPFDSDVRQLALDQWQYQREVTPHPASYIIERELSGVWNDVVVNNEAMIESLDKAVLASNREIKRKLIEFGYMTEDGELIRDYNTRIMDMLYEKLGGE